MSRIVFSHTIFITTSLIWEYLLPEFKHLDFLWLMKGDEVCDEAMQETIQTIRSIPQVQLVAELTK